MHDPVDNAIYLPELRPLPPPPSLDEKNYLTTLERGRGAVAYFKKDFEDGIGTGVSGVSEWWGGTIGGVIVQGAGLVGGKT